MRFMRRVSLLGPSRSGNTLVELLMECHGRIREHLELAIRLTEVEAPPGDVAACATRLVRYFGEALPLHSADEDESIARRLGPASLEQELETIRLDHERIHRLLEGLLATWRRIELEPAALRSEREAARCSALELAKRFRSHLELEETRVFPAVARLPAAEQAAIVQELRARRAPAA